MLSATTALILLLLTGILGIALGYILRFLQMTVAKAQLEVNVRKTLNKAKAKAQKIVADAYDQTESTRQELEDRQYDVVAKQRQVEQKLKDLETNDQELQANIIESNKILNQYKTKLAQLLNDEPVSLSTLKTELKTLVDLNLESYYSQKIKDLESTYQRRFEELIIETLPQITRRTVRDNTSVTINISSNEIGKVIGREGTNIKALERYCGVDLIIDDQVNTVTISSFNPKKRFIAKQTIIELLADGRINRDTIKKRHDDVSTRLHQEAEKLLQKGLLSLNYLNLKELTSEIRKELAELYFRHSYGQNQLEHSLETADIAGKIALAVNPKLAPNASLAGLLHDIGKNSLKNNDHITAGLDLIQKNQEFSPDVVTAIREHHSEASNSVLSAILKAADSLSSGRPGARNQSISGYLTRLEKIEKFLQEFETVDNAYVVSGGKEAYVFIKANIFTPAELQQTAVIITDKLKSSGLITQSFELHLIKELEITKTVA